MTDLSDILALLTDNLDKISIKAMPAAGYSPDGRGRDVLGRFKV
ncbi:hypothetical protein [Nostoc sp.]